MLFFGMIRVGAQNRVLAWLCVIVFLVLVVLFLNAVTSNPPDNVSSSSLNQRLGAP